MVWPRRARLLARARRAHRALRGGAGPKLCPRAAQGVEPLPYVGFPLRPWPCTGDARGERPAPRAGQMPPTNVSLGASAVDPAQLEFTLERLLATMQRRNRDDFAFMSPVEEALSAEQCLDVLLSGQEYYRKQYSDAGITWNLRDQHMVSTVMRLAEHLEIHSTSPPGAPPPGIVIWAHNSHIGDARATDHGKSAGQWNLGHMVRETFGAEQTFLLGFSTHDGEVYAAHEWGQPGRKVPLRPAMGGSWEDALQQESARLRDAVTVVSATGAAPKSAAATVEGVLWPCGAPGQPQELREASLLHRLVGVVYKPNSERESHCSATELCDMYDAVLHIGSTTAVEPIS
eukprot:NODE_6163_length_1699_cov_5.312977.p1 GENE.NODE_6163_length_1699_cov_5.312977~~NODE_6163_length_1699_cov_5.312977.p1  ORF type:complete len:345 (-),score=78.08 NODE_6163_length_1699_cov_5.312977:236-1270(-)